MYSLSESLLQKTELKVGHPHKFSHNDLYLIRHLRILDKRKLGKTFARIQELSQKKNEEYEELSEIRRREKSLQEKVNNVRSIYDEPSRVKAKKKEQELG